MVASTYTCPASGHFALPLGEGADRAPRQAGPGTGADEGGTVGAVDDAYSYRTPSDVIRVPVTPRTDGQPRRNPTPARSERC